MAACVAAGAERAGWLWMAAGAAALATIGLLLARCCRYRAGGGLGGGRTPVIPSSDSRRIPTGRGAAIFLLTTFFFLGVFSGSVRLLMIEHSGLAPLAGERIAARVTVVSPVIEKDGRLRFTGEVEAARLPGAAPPPTAAEDAVIELTCRHDCPRELAAMPEGTRLELDKASVTLPASSPGSDFDYEQYLRRQGIHVILKAGTERAELLPEGRSGLAGLIDSLRGHARETLALGGWGSAGELLKGMVLGDDQGVPQEVIDDFRDAGLLHMLAVSGQNVALLGFIILLLLRGLMVPRLPALGISIAVIAAYIPLTGAGPSIVRAGIVGILGMAAMVFSRQSDRCHFLALSAAVILFLSPYSLLDPGFQLSYAAVLAIFFLAPVLEGLIRLIAPPLPALLAQGLAISTATGLATAPITLADFGQVSLVSVPANIAAEPVAGPVMMLGALAILAQPVLPPAAWMLDTLACLCTGYLIELARFMASLPGAVYRHGSPGMLATSGFYAMLIAIVTVARRTCMMAAFSRLRAGRGLLAPLVLLLVLLAGLSCAASRVSTGPPPDSYRVSFLDIGQGDATLIQVPPATAILIDGGPGAQVVDRLRERGVTRLDAVYLTHPHADHVAGLIDVLEQFPVGAVFDAAPPSSSDIYRDFLKLIEQKRIPYHVTRKGQTGDYGELHLDILSPGDDLKSDDLNADSLVILARYRGLDILIPGDAEGETLTGLDLPPAAVYKVPHHGSRDGSISRVLTRVRPGTAVISVGEGNTYGHPADSTLAALAKAGVRTYRTDRQGTVTVMLAGDAVEIATSR